MTINRVEEVELDKLLNSEKFEFIVLYGRRRVGKTTLIKKVIEKYNGFYYLGLDVGKKEQISRLKSNLSNYLNDNLLQNISFSSYSEIFSYIFQNKNTKEKQIFVLDEFQYFFYKEYSVLSDFQYIIDELLSKSKVKIIVLGSSISMIENSILGYKSPLYGRKTAIFNIKSFGINEFAYFFPKYSFKELIEIYTVTNGVPYYANFLDSDKNPIDNIKQNILKSGSIFLDEAMNILKYEISEFRTYFLILDYIARGANKFGEISSKTGLEKSNLTRYLLTLQEIYLVKKESPILEDQNKSKKSLYKIDDLFIKFWFSYIWGNRDLIDFDITKIHNILDSNFDFYVSSSLDKIIYDFIYKNIKLDFEIFKIGRQWDKNYEFDICAFDYDKKNILLGEIKWTNKKIDLSVFMKLKEKSDFIKDFQNKTFILISKSGFTEEVLSLESKKLILVNLSELFLTN